MKVPQQQKYVVLEARFRPAISAPLDPESKLYACFMVVQGEVEARNVAQALERGKRFLRHPIVEEAASFWARIEAAKVLKNASKARYFARSAE